LSQLLARATGPAKDAQVLIHALALLVHSGQIKMVRADAKIDPVPARRLNLALVREIECGRAVHVLAAPAAATGITAGLTDFGLMLARDRGLALDARTIARTTWGMIEATSIRPTRDGKALQDSEALEHLTQAADQHLAERLKILEALCI
jgi:TPR repeat protein